MTAAGLRNWQVRGSYFEACNCEAICPCHSWGGRPGVPSTAASVLFEALEQIGGTATDATSWAVRDRGSAPGESPSKDPPEQWAGHKAHGRGGGHRSVGKEWGMPLTGASINAVPVRDGRAGSH